MSVPDGETFAFAYDANARLSSASTSRGSVVTMAYQASLPIRETWSGTSTVTEGASTIWSGAVNGEVKRFYNTFAELSRVQVVGGFDATYTRDLDGLVTGVANTAGGTTVPTLQTPRNASDGRLTGTTQGQVSTTLDYGRNAAGQTSGEVRVATATGGGTQRYRSEYQYDAASRIARWSLSMPSASRVRRYHYDDVGRLDVVRDDAGNELDHFVYDANGNRIREVSEEHGTTEYSCGNGMAASEKDQLCTVGDRAYKYDARGMLSRIVSPAGQREFRYDGAGRLQRATLEDGDEIHYVHDGKGRRIARIVNGVRDKSWIYADGLRPIAQLNATGQLEATFVYATQANIPDFVVERTGATSTVTYRVIADHLGTPRLLVRTSDGVVVHELDVDEWGRVLRDEGVKKGLHPFGFAGGLFDRDTELTQFGARDYDAYSGRWTTRDPILFDGADSICMRT